MIYRLAAAVAPFLLLAQSAFAGAAVDFDGVAKGTLNEALAGQDVPEVSAPQAETRELADWTIMVFSNAKNDLEEYLIADLNEMELVGSTSKMNVVVELGRVSGYDASNGDWTGVRRYLVTKDSDMNTIASKKLADLGMVDMGDYRNLAAFGKWAKQAYPAKHYMLIIENHGSGWEKSLRGPMTNRGISYDEESGNHINTPQLALALKEMGKVDVFGTDACLMQMAEVVYEIKDGVDYIVGSEETEPGDGYTYNDFLGPVARNPGMSPLELGKQAVNAYADHYDGIRQGYTQSLVIPAKSDRLLALTNAFAAAVMATKNEQQAILYARRYAVNFAMEENRDLYDFTRLLVEKTGNAEVKRTGRELMTFLTSELVAHNRGRDKAANSYSEGKKYTSAKGIAAYFPESSLGAGYRELAWAKASQWDEFMNWINRL
jgi:hypothetical protein